MDNNNLIGKRINEALAIRGIKQKELAKEIGVQDNTVSYWCSGSRTPNTHQIIQIAKALNVSTDFLLGLTDSKTTDKDLRFVCEYTGLSEEAIEHLCKLNKSDLSSIFLDEGTESWHSEKKYLDRVARKNSSIINRFISSTTFEILVNYLYQLLQIDEDALEYLSLYFKDFDYTKMINSDYDSDFDLIQTAKYFVNEYQNDAIHNALQDQIDLLVFNIQRTIISYCEQVPNVIFEINSNNLEVAFDWLRFAVFSAANNAYEANKNIEVFNNTIDEYNKSDTRFKNEIIKIKEIFEKAKQKD